MSPRCPVVTLGIRCIREAGHPGPHRGHVHELEATMKEGEQLPPTEVREVGSQRAMDRRFSFGEAIESLKAGYAVQREGWNGKGMFLKLQVPDAHSKMTLPYIYMSTVQGDLVPWLASQTDMLAEDWRVVRP